MAWYFKSLWSQPWDKQNVISPSWETTQVSTLQRHILKVVRSAWQCSKTDWRKSLLRPKTFPKRFKNNTIYKKKSVRYFINSLTAIDAHERQRFNELRGTVVSRRVFIRSQSLIARWTRNDLILAAVAPNLYEACRIDDVSRGSKSHLFWAS